MLRFLPWTLYQKRSLSTRKQQGISPCRHRSVFRLVQHTAKAPFSYLELFVMQSRARKGRGTKPAPHPSIMHAGAANLLLVALPACARNAIPYACFSANDHVRARQTCVTRVRSGQRTGWQTHQLRPPRHRRSYPPQTSSPWAAR